MVFIIVHCQFTPCIFYQSWEDYFDKQPDEYVMNRLHYKTRLIRRLQSKLHHLQDHQQSLQGPSNRINTRPVPKIIVIPNDDETAEIPNPFPFAATNGCHSTI